MKRLLGWVGLAAIAIVISLWSGSRVLAADQAGSIGIEGTVSAPPPSVAAIISIPGNGQTFTSLPINVSGICSGNDLLVKIYKNGVFAGSVQCSNGSFGLKIDLFSGKNDLVARVYDNLDQAGPDSNTVSVTYNDETGANPATSQVVLSSNYAKRGAPPRQKFSWPLTVSGGEGPYAVSVDWGDGGSSLLTVKTVGEFSIEHAYQAAGVYKVAVKAVDSAGRTAFLQITGFGSGAAQQTASQNGNQSASSSVVYRVLWWVYVIFFALLLSTFWLGRRYERRRLTHE